MLNVFKTTLKLPEPRVKNNFEHVHIIESTGLAVRTRLEFTENGDRC